ncbi:MAG: AAA family ATPase [Nanoarchaeota archaeon]|nr:AAA family ATPase [Nanoarchaeota archaeon]MBU4284184.1 AAA family ATPase [Nanoarchaeota archaeon]MBU4493243.1 AAA family ATPase [Nanoarchaeota archaeon]
MALFKDMLKSDETLFKNSVALDYDYMPKLIKYREGEQQQMASCIKPLLQRRNGRNLFIYGRPGIGKTVACRHVLQDLEQESDEIIPIYINCWQKNTSFKILIEICSIIGYKLTHNKKTDELFSIVKSMLNKKSAVFVFDESDKLEDFDFLYMILEEIYRKSIFLITNSGSWISELDGRIKSRLTPEMLEFRPYNQEETRGILKERINYAFVESVWDEDAVEFAVNETFSLGDIRSGLFILKEAGNSAEDRSSRKITVDDVKKAIEKLTEFSTKKSSELEEDKKFILDIIKKNSGKKIGEIYKEYQAAGGKAVYKTFQRKIAKLDKDKFISTEKITGGKEGKTTVINYKDITKKITDF